MAKKKQTAGKTKTILVLRDGSEHEVVSESGKYYFCEGTQFRKMNPTIAAVETRDAKTKQEDTDHADRK